MVELKIEISGIEFKNPVVVASSEATLNFERMKKCVEAGAGGLVCKTITTIERARRVLRPRWAIVDKKGFPDIFTFYSVGALSPYPPEKFAEEIKRAKKNLDVPIIASIMGKEYDDWRYLAKLVEDAGADMVELNLSCPFLPEVEKSAGRSVGEDPNLAAKVVKEVVNAVSIPVIAKLTPETAQLVEVAKSVEEAGASGITAVNRFMGLEIDVEKAKPIIQPAFAGYGGPYLRGIGLRWVAKLAPEVKIPIFGCGGIMNWSHAVEYIMVGATAVQLFTAIVAKGYGVIGDIVKGIKDFMERHGYSKIEDFRGIALKNIRASYELPVLNLVASIDEEKCNACGLCARSCLAEAIIISEKGNRERRMVFVDVDKCEGCGFCVSLCPFCAVTMVPKPS
jgi:dihydroorotate dehydrogenase (fumarate)/dihydropyrimidine dehydrogenase (NAD+) subunit PreA